ncbi:methyl-accepting chemotaxis protein [Clostridiaceae bacterium OttesenSCG-928-D20]|nr:methyl-accepting chemotaxis protein [Clostridiaceae bacterium OttesenSCG-928-D20]
MKIKHKIMLPMIIIAIITTFAVLFTAAMVFSVFVDNTTAEDIRRGSAVMVSEFEGRAAEADSVAMGIANDRTIINAMKYGQEDVLIEKLKWYRDKDEVDFVTLTDVDGVVIYRVHEPNKKGDSLLSQSGIPSALRGQSSSTVESTQVIPLSVRSAAPIYSDKTVIGAISVGYKMDNNSFVDRIKSITGCESTVFLGDTRLSTTVTNSSGNRVTGTKASENVSKTVLGGKEYEGFAEVVDRDAFVKYVPLKGANGSVIGMLFVGKFVDVKWSAVTDFVLKGGITAVIILIIATLFTLYSTKKITKPIQALVSAGHRLSAGETDIEISINTKDEIAELGEVFKEIIESSREKEQAIVAIAEGDLSVGVEPKSDKDSLTLALQKMLYKNNEVFGEILRAAEYVASSALQLATGSQNLAQGSAEQAGVVDDLRFSIIDVSDKANQNAGLGREAATLSEKALSNAEIGNMKMSELVAAVNEINETSRIIAGIIKTIDDIAFQTNILSLNAAVEAARAGEFGKGFAVVAEEIRSLANESAKAAKDTEEIINNTINKAKLGADIASDTAASLGEIVRSIQESSRMMREVSNISTDSAEALSQINNGIDVVSRVTIQNSATSQETAAASEEMSKQSQILRRLVSQFKLKDISSFPEIENEYSLPYSDSELMKY